MVKTVPSRFLPVLAMCLLGCTALSGSAQAGLFDFGGDAKPATEAQAPGAAKDAHPAAADLDTMIRQAQQERIAGQYQDAVKTLSQLMLVAADDGRVVCEYGKTLVSMGRAQEALGFLNRAQQLQAGDWTIYNALGVAYDEMDKQAEAREAYERALALKPGDPAVLNNYALSRMLAKDPDGARALIARAQSAGGAADPKIAHNIAMINELSPQTAPVHEMAMAQPVAAPHVAVSSQPLPQLQAITAASTVPRPLQPAPPRQARDTRVVMQAVPVDPLAGPVAARAPHPHAAPAPEKTAAKAAVKPEPKPLAAAKSAQDKPVAAAKPATAKPQPPMAVARLDMTPPKADAKGDKTAKGDAVPALRLSANAY